MTLSPSSPAATDSPHRIVDRFHWDWYQRAEPGPELLGDITDRVVVELGAGSGRQAAYLAHAHRPARVVAVDSDPAQHARGRERFGGISRLDLVHDDAVTYLAKHPDTFDVAYCGTKGTCSTVSCTAACGAVGATAGICGTTGSAATPVRRRSA